MASEDSTPVKKEDNATPTTGPKKVTTSNSKPQPNLSKLKKDSKVKKEDNDDDCDEEDDNLLAIAKRSSNNKVKKENNDGDKTKKTSNTKRTQEPKIKKELSDDDYDDDEDEKPLAKTKKTSNTKVTKEVVKNKIVKKEIKEEIVKKEVVGGVEPKKREKKVYDLPGQKRDTPEEKDPLRIFYQTLYKQVPSSEMSQIWLMESGLLPKDLAMKVFEKKQKKGLQQKITSPVKTGTTVKSSTKSVTVKKKHPASPELSAKKKTPNSPSKQSKKRKSESESSEDDDDSDFDTGSKKPAKRRKAT